MEQCKAHKCLCAKKRSWKEGRTIVLINKSGLSERRIGHTHLGARANDAAADLSFQLGQARRSGWCDVVAVLFPPLPGCVCAQQVVDFNRRLIRLLRGSLPVMWGGLVAHRNALVNRFVKGTRGRRYRRPAACLCPRIEHLRISLWPFQAPRSRQLQSRGLAASIERGAQDSSKGAAIPNSTSAGFLETGRTGSLLTCFSLPQASIVLGIGPLMRREWTFPLSRKRIPWLGCSQMGPYGS